MESNPYIALKTDNRNRIFNLIRESGRISKPEVSRKLGLSIPTAIQHINELVSLGCLKEGETLGKTGGRRAKSYTVNETFRYAIGIYLLAEKFVITAADFCGNFLETDTIRLPFLMNNTYYKELGRILDEHIQLWRLEPQKILGVGIALPGLTTEDQQLVYYGKALNITGLSTLELARYIPYPCRLYNDSDAAGYAEISQNAKIRDTFYIYLSENIGGAVLIDGKIYGGENAKSGKIGHMTMVPDGKTCYCGRKGCFETVCSASVIRNVCGGEIPDFFLELKNGNSSCLNAWNTYLDYLAKAIVNVRMLFDTQIVLGGTISEYMEPYFPDLMERVTALDSFDNPTGYLALCRAPHNAAALGSALFFVHDLWHEI